MTKEDRMAEFDMAKELTKAESYPESVDSISLIQTHISWVFLTGKYCYKVKKPVDFEFLNFSTLEKRKFYCGEELRVNRRLCPDIYVDVVPITAASDGLHVEGKGDAVDYAVKMVQLPQERRMDLLLGDGKVDGEIIDEISKTLAEFHRAARTGEGVDEYGSPETIKANWDQNFEQTRNLRGELVPEDLFDSIEDRVNGFILNNSKMFNERIESNKIRECHGDVHSGNIFVDGRIYIFDAIEFNPAFSCSDVASEIAFLAMDLDFKGRKDLSESFVDGYVECSRDEGVHDLLNFYKCYRAYVRAKVIGFKLFDAGVGQEEKSEAEGLCKDYFSLAQEYAVNF